IPNGEDDDTDGDGEPDTSDDDDDNDGIPDGEDPDDDNDGTPDDEEPDNDGDGEPDKTDTDDDNDGTPDGEDTDDDGDGTPDDKEPGDDKGPCDDSPGPYCGSNVVAPIDQSDWPITNDDHDPDGNYTLTRGFQIEGSVCLDQGARAWRYRVSRLVWRGKINTSTNSDLVSTEPVPVVGGNVNSNNYCEITTSMRGYLGRGRGPWHLRAASLAHEIYHRDIDFPGIARPIWQDIEAAIEAESVPCDRSLAEAEAILQIWVNQARGNLQTQFSEGVSAFNVGHNSARNDGAYQAAQNVLNVRIGEVGTFATGQGWPACPGGASRPAAPAAGGPPILVALEAEAPSPVVRPGQATQLRVLGRYRDGS
ncbi:MAG: hypothetical protein ACKOET_04190, partial [Verrucomicrobiota bacterium]